MKQYYKEEELVKHLVRPLRTGDRFFVKDKLTEDSNDEMEELCSTWVEVVDSGDLSSFSSIKDGAYYTIREDGYEWFWSEIHMNIYETNLQLLKKSNTFIVASKRERPRLPLI